jgi:hypothetical protein
MSQPDRARHDKTVTIDLSYARRFPRTCCYEVSRAGDVVPCDRLAVAVRHDDEGHGYPVCKYHAAGDMVPLAELLKAQR